MPKRVTKKKYSLGRWHYAYNCKPSSDCLLEDSCGNCMSSELLRTLGEIEDGFDNKIIIRLPCKVGDIVSIKCSDRSFVEREAKEVIIYKNAIKVNFKGRAVEVLGNCVAQTSKTAVWGVSCFPKGEVNGK